MADYSLDTRTQFIWVILGRCNSPLTKDFQFYYEKLAVWLKEKCKVYAYIGHDKDKTDDDKPKFRHIHLLAVYKDSESNNYPRLSTSLNHLAKVCYLPNQDIDIQVAEDVDKCIRYCIHKGYPLKFQYPLEELQSNLSKEELDTIMNHLEEDNSVSPDYLISCVKINKGSCIAMVKALGLKKYMKYRYVIKDIKDELIYGN